MLARVELEYCNARRNNFCTMNLGEEEKFYVAYIVSSTTLKIGLYIKLTNT